MSESGDDEIDTAPLAWCAAPPSEPGWYWVLTGWGTVQIAHVLSVHHGGDVILPAHVHHYACANFTHWLGPLPEPEPPTFWPLTSST